VSPAAIIRLVLLVLLAGVIVALVIAALPALFRALRGSVWYARGLRAYRREDYDRARQAWERAVAIVPWYASAHYNLGVLHAKHGRTEEAVAAYEHAIEHNPNLAKAHFNLGNACMALEEYRKAAAAYQAATETSRGHVRSHLSLGLLYQEVLLDDRKALHHLTEYVRLGGTDLRVLANIHDLQQKVKA